MNKITQILKVHLHFYYLFLLNLYFNFHHHYYYYFIIGCILNLEVQNHFPHYYCFLLHLAFYCFDPHLINLIFYLYFFFIRSFLFPCFFFFLLLLLISFHKSWYLLQRALIDFSLFIEWIPIGVLTPFMFPFSLFHVLIISLKGLKSMWYFQLVFPYKFALYNLS